MADESPTVRTPTPRAASDGGPTGSPSDAVPDGTTEAGSDPGSEPAVEEAAPGASSAATPPAGPPPGGGPPQRHPVGPTPARVAARHHRRRRRRGDPLRDVAPDAPWCHTDAVADRIDGDRPNAVGVRVAIGRGDAVGADLADPGPAVTAPTRRLPPHVEGSLDGPADQRTRLGEPRRDRQRPDRPDRTSAIRTTGSA